MNQLVLHLDKLPLYGNGWKPKVIIRTMVAHDEPMDPGVQHLGDLSQIFFDALETVKVETLLDSSEIVEAYEVALKFKGAGSSLLIEYAKEYDSD
jgi:hypothetical protein